MYEQNIGKPGKNYIVRDIFIQYNLIIFYQIILCNLNKIMFQEKLMNSDDCSIVELVKQARGELSVEKKKTKSCFRTKFVKELNHVGSVLKLKNTLFACIVAFCLTSSYYTLFMWFPEIFQRFADFDAQHLNGCSSNICTISSKNYSSESNKVIISIV